jgi:opine dehydrogenase
MNNRITIIGGGNNGLTMAAHLALTGHEVCLWNRTAKTIAKILETHEIHISGIIAGTAKLTQATTSMEEAVKDARYIFITQPAHTHCELAVKMAAYLKPDSIVVLNPGRTFGALEFYNTLTNNNCKNMPLVAETQTIIYTCRKSEEDNVTLLAMKTGTLLSCINHPENEAVINMLPEILHQFFHPAQSIIETSFGNVGMILHCAPVLLNAGWIENKTTEFLYYYDGITPSIARLLEKLDLERVSVAAKFGISVPSVQQWLKDSYLVSGDNLYQSLQQVHSYKTIDAPGSLQHRYIYEDVCTGLVPLEAIGIALGLNMKITTLIIDLADEIMNEDFRKMGRNSISLGLTDEIIAKLLKNPVEFRFV